MQPQYNFSPIVADASAIRTPLDVVALVNRQLLRVSSVLAGARAYDVGSIATGKTINPSVADLSTATLIGDVTVTIEMGKTRPGATGFLELAQDATGGRVVTWTNLLNSVSVAAGANQRTLIQLVRVADGWVASVVASAY